MFHGGNLALASQQYHIPLSDWLDLSTGINPAPYPVPTLPDDLWHKLPSPTLLNQSETAARQYYGVSDEAALVLAPGSSCLIAALPQLRPKAKVTILIQSYQEHLNAWRKAKAEIILRPLTPFSSPLTQLLDETPQTIHKDQTNSRVVILVNPNNPTGQIYSPQELLKLHDSLNKEDLLIIDEAFMDMTPQNSLAPFAGRKGVIILRSFGKFFGLAGMRLGCAIGHKDDIALLKTKLGPWPLSGPTIAIATKAFSDDDWIKQTRIGLAQKSDQLESLLIKHGLTILGSTDLFTLVRHDEIKQIHKTLAQNAIWTRLFDYEKNWMRIGLPWQDRDFQKLDVSFSGYFIKYTQNTRKP